jgi:LysM repeat protein
MENKNSDPEIDEMMEDMAEDVERSRPEDREDREWGPLSDLSAIWQPMALGGIIVLILVAVLYFLFSSGKGPSREDLVNIRSGIDLIEKRLALLEEDKNEGTPMAGQISGLQASLSKLDRSGRSLKKQVNRLTERVNQLQKEMATAQRTVQGQQPPKETTSAKAERRYHTVRPGDTLYNIARTYGLSVDELRRINRFKKTQDIFPNQKILVTP